MAKNRYHNYDNVENKNTFTDMLRWSKERRNKKKDLSTQIPQAETKQVERLKKNKQDFSITWIGHSSFLIQFAGVNILTDPVWAKRMGLQKRLTEPGLPIEKLPEIDIVLISHGHYDHLDFPTLKKLRGDITYYVPIGLKALFIRKGYQRIVEANWWELFSYKSLKITFVPAQHWTKRTLTDTNKSHWGGWVIESTETERNVYFAGDSGYFRGFKEIGKRFDIDVVLMPIGAYEPEWFMAVSHINPEDAIKAYLELKGRKFIPMHYGAYRLADDTGPEALARFLKEWERLELDKKQLDILKIGESLWLDYM
ncbi:MBL fold metallo-hydrolase [Bacillus sp. EB600]|uniref:MBL fold metallo-hydrolase n=1 Tax=Bacillus sp. EB600 TaxID=2806345 RepID=UPI00210ECD71|nr:MBL fold metallo-hydrolase [Bacillus sp. EB600]MCQ6280747.1 MBL fold metallo-hydrolase [Bacillus sp. EB600]